VIAVRGAAAWDVARTLFQPRSKRVELPALPQAGSFWLGRIGDDVVLTVKEVEPQPWVEVHCHGGRETVRLILDTLETHGVVPCRWKEFLGRSEPNPIRAAASVALAEALTVRTAAILLDQYHDAWENVVAEITRNHASGLHERVTQSLADLSARIELGRHLTAPWRIVVAGPPNVGKSSLVNALVGYERCIVAPTPGTTRDVVHTLIALDGWPVEIADSAGLRHGGDSLEREGMELARSAMTAADRCLWVMDASQPPVWAETTSDRLRIVVNKIDLPAAWDVGQATRVSARTGEGIAELATDVARWLVRDPLPAGAAVPFTEGLCDAVVAACRAQAEGDFEQALAIIQACHGQRTE
jgi:tRNA modification GTPase